jgi:hypothetical protein
MMRQAIALLCCLIVGLEVVVGLAGVVGIACLLAYGGAPLGPMRMDFHVGEPPVSHEARLPPPSIAAAAWPETGPAQAPLDIVPDLAPAPAESSIVSLREEQGGLLAGTVLGQSLSPATEQDLFVGALRQAAAEDAQPGPANAQAAPASDQAAVSQPVLGEQAATSLTIPCPTIPTRSQAAEFAVERLYEMAAVDERVGEFERADQWRALARGLRQTVLGESTVLGENTMLGESLVEPIASAQELD